MYIFKNSKKGDVSVVSKLIITMVVLALLIFGYKKISDGSTKVLQCTTQGGRCTVGTCDFQSEIPVLSSKAAGCEKEEICCVSLEKTSYEPDPECKDKSGTLTRCSKVNDGVCEPLTGKCVSECDFCNAHPTESICKANYFGKGNTFSCSCTQTECDALGGNRCIKGYCGAGASYCCYK